MAKKIPKIPLVQQEKSILSIFPTSKIIRTRNHTLKWAGKLTPTPLSGTYEVRFDYREGYSPKAYVVSPIPLVLHPDQDKLPHVFSHEEQRLCLFFPDGTEWNPSMLLVRTIIPWISEWLFFYEIWVGTGTWLGGEVQHGPNKIES